MSHTTPHGPGSGSGKETFMKYLVAVLLLAVGVAGVVAGEADDSPSLQLLGLLVGVGAIVLGVRTARRPTRPAPK
jgi:branched-subunit amino acid transport protein